MHQVLIDGISNNMASLVQPGKYGTISTADTTTNRYPVIQFFLEAQTLQNNKTIDRKIISTVQLVLKSKYL